MSVWGDFPFCCANQFIDTGFIINRPTAHSVRKQLYSKICLYNQKQGLLPTGLPCLVYLISSQHYQFPGTPSAPTLWPASPGKRAWRNLVGDSSGSLNCTSAQKYVLSKCQINQKTLLIKHRSSSLFLLFEFISLCLLLTLITYESYFRCMLAMKYIITHLCFSQCIPMHSLVP